MIWPSRLIRGHQDMIRLSWSGKIHLIIGSIKYYLGQGCYWLRCHTYNRYHIIDCRSPDYRWGWADVDYRMEQACFELLCQFVEDEWEGELPKYGPYDLYMDPAELAQIKVQEEYNIKIFELYKWWKEGRFKEAELLKVHVNNDEDNIYKLLDNKREKMFRRLIAMRHYLWT